MKVGKTFIQIRQQRSGRHRNAGEQIEGATARHSGPDRDPEADLHPKLTCTPKASANATPVPVEGEGQRGRGCFLRRLIEQTIRKANRLRFAFFFAENGATVNE